MAVNPDAVAWYLRRSEAVLEDHRERVAALRGRAGQLAGFSGAVLTLAGANAETVLASLHGAARSLSTSEVANYATDRFIEESEVWRAQLRTIRAVSLSIESITRLNDLAARQLQTAQRLFFGGLSLIGGALGTLVIAVTF